MATLSAPDLREREWLMHVQRPRTDGRSTRLRLLLSMSLTTPTSPGAPKHVGAEVISSLADYFLSFRPRPRGRIDRPVDMSHLGLADITAAAATTLNAAAEHPKVL